MNHYRVTDTQAADDGVDIWAADYMWHEHACVILARAGIGAIASFPSARFAVELIEDPTS